MCELGDKYTEDFLVYNEVNIKHIVSSYETIKDVNMFCDLCHKNHDLCQYFCEPSHKLFL
jgi:hypothetical protein